MRGYRLYILDDNGHIQAAHEMGCNDDGAAIAMAKSLFQTDRRELWHLARMVKAFPALDPLQP